MALYVSIVLLATLTALPSGAEGGDAAAHSVHGVGLVGLIWGTTLGLAIAHWFAFRLTARGFGGGKVSEQDLHIGLAQMAGAAFVALLCTIPVIVVGGADEIRVTRFVPALIVGVAGYLAAKASGRTRSQSLILGVLVMIVGLTVAAVKNFLIGH